MNNVERLVEIGEYQTKEVPDLNEAKDLPYLKRDCFRYKSIAPYKIRELRDNKIQIENTSFDSKLCSRLFTRRSGTFNS